MTVWNCAVVRGASGHVVMAAVAASMRLCHLLVKVVSHLATRALYAVMSPLVTNFDSAFCRQYAYFPATLFFPDWHFCSGVTPPRAALASSRSAVMKPKNRMSMC